MSKYYHGSHLQLEIGSIILPRDNYEDDWNNTDFYNALEKYRPLDMISHKGGVFMCDNEDDIDLAGGSIDYIYEVVPIGKVEKHDMNWSSEISCLISEGYSVDSEEVKLAADNYWRGFPHTDENVWEYLCEKFLVKELTYCDNPTPSF